MLLKGTEMEVVRKGQMVCIDKKILLEGVSSTPLHLVYKLSFCFLIFTKLIQGHA